jgi:hypothetical protein
MGAVHLIQPGKPIALALEDGADQSDFDWLFFFGWRAEWMSHKQHVRGGLGLNHRRAFLEFDSAILGFCYCF